MTEQVEPGAIGLPKYYPLHSSLERTVKNFILEDSSKNLKALQADLRATYEKYVDTNLELLKDDLEEVKLGLLKDKIVGNFNETYEKINELRSNETVLANLMSKTKLEMLYRYRNEEELNMETLEQYREILDPPLEVNDLFVRNYEDTAERTRIDKEYSMNKRQFENEISVYIDPFMVVTQDEEADADGLEVAGGRIELKCPLSRSLMKDPVITECLHTFEKEALQQYRRSSSNCPVCGVLMGAITKDKLMVIRLKAYARDQNLL